MKKISLILITLFTTGTMLMAQGGPRGGQRNMDPKARAEHMTERMAKQYSLNDAQKKQVYEVNLAMAENMKPAKGDVQKADAKKKDRKDAKAKGKKDKKGKAERMANRPSQEDRDKRMAEMKKSREDYDAKIKQIFSKEQYDSYTKNQAERQKRMADRGRRHQQRTNN